MFEEIIEQVGARAVNQSKNRLKIEGVHGDFPIVIKKGKLDLKTPVDWLTRFFNKQRNKEINSQENQEQ